MKKIKKNSMYGIKANVITDEIMTKEQQYNEIIQSLKDTLSLLEGEHFQLLDLDCSVKDNNLVVYPLCEENIIYKLNELDIVGLSMLENNLLSILSEKRIL